MEDKKLLELADMLLDKLRICVERWQPEQLNPQMMKHATGVLKDLKDIRTGADPEAAQVTVVFEGKWEDCCE